MGSHIMRVFPHLNSTRRPARADLFSTSLARDMLAVQPAALPACTRRAGFATTIKILQTTYKNLALLYHCMCVLLCIARSDAKEFGMPIATRR